MPKLKRRLRPSSALFLFGVAAAAALPLAGRSTPASAAALVDPSIDAQIADFYRARGGAPLWLSPTSGAAAQQLLSAARDRAGRQSQPEAL